MSTTELDQFLQDPQGWLEKEYARYLARRKQLVIDFSRQCEDNEEHLRQMEYWAFQRAREHNVILSPEDARLKAAQEQE